MSTFKESKSRKKCDPAKDITPGGVDTGPPNHAEILGVMKKLKRGKSANDVPAAYLKHLMEYDEFVNKMVHMYSTIWITKKVPAKWAHAKLVAIWKGAAKAKVEDPKAYRGIQIESTFCKIMIVIILNQLKQWYENQISDQQKGFRTGRGTTDGIFILKHVQQISH